MSAGDVIVIGGGITGLAAARDLAIAGAQVTLVEPHHPGGKLRTTPFAGGALDEAADAFLARVPEGVELCRELGIEGDLVSPAARRAYVWSHGELRLLPEAQLLGVPTDLDELAASGIVSAAGIEAARHDLTAPRSPLGDDPAIGTLLRDRLGDEVVDLLVDPLVGGINAGDTDRLSLAATVPQLDAAARSDTSSIIEACRAQRAAVADASAPVFFAPRGGMGVLAERTLAAALAHGLALVTASAAALEPRGSRWRAVLDDGSGIDGDAVVIATPAPHAAALLHAAAPPVAATLAAIDHASVAMVSIAIPVDRIDRALDASGFLVPVTEGRTITACSWTTAKWPHLFDGHTAWLRASVGRDGDDRARALTEAELVAAVLADLADTMGLRGTPEEVRVTRWLDSFPQYRPGHLERVAAMESDLAVAAPRVVVAGAALRGLGVPACIRQGRAAAARILAAAR